MAVGHINLRLHNHMLKRVSKTQLNSISGSATAALLQETVNAGGDATKLLAGAHLRCSFEDLRSGKVASIPRSHFALLSRECIAILERHACSFSDHAPMEKDDFEMLCYCVINCKNLQEVILRAATFCRMLRGRAGALALQRDASTAAFVMTTQRGKPTSSALLADMLGLSAYHRLFGWLIGETIENTGLQICSPELIGADTILELFHYPVVFDAPHNQFVFSAHYLEKPVIRSYQELVELLKFFPFDLISADLNIRSLHETLHTIIKTRMLQHEPMPTIAQLASLFNVSNATLRRRLDDEKTSISIIKEKCRHDWAKELLQLSNITLEETADKLGFSDAGAFRRAFKSWTGMSPSDYRRALLSQSQNNTDATPVALSHKR